MKDGFGAFVGEADVAHDLLGDFDEPLIETILPVVHKLVREVLLHA